MAVTTPPVVTSHKTQSSQTSGREVDLGFSITISTMILLIFVRLHPRASGVAPGRQWSESSSFGVAVRARTIMTDDRAVRCGPQSSKNAATHRGYSRSRTPLPDLGIQFPSYRVSLIPVCCVYICTHIYGCG